LEREEQGLTENLTEEELEELKNLTEEERVNGVKSPISSFNNNTLIY